MSVTSSPDTTFDHVQVEANKHLTYLAEKTKASLRSHYHANPKTAINLLADSKAYMSDEMHYNKSAQARIENAKLQRAPGRYAKNKALAETEFKILSTRYKQDDAFVRKGELEEYVDSYYTMLKQTASSDKVPKHSKHLKLMYNTLFPDDPTYAEKRADDNAAYENVVQLTEDDVSFDRAPRTSESQSPAASTMRNVFLTQGDGEGRRKGTMTTAEIRCMRARIRAALEGTGYGEKLCLEDLRRYIRGKVLVRDIAEEQDLMMEMLKMVGHITLGGKTADNLLASTKVQMRHAHVNIDKAWKNSSQKMQVIEKDIYANARRLQALNAGKRNQRDALTKPVTPAAGLSASVDAGQQQRVWRTAADVKESIRAKTEILKRLRAENARNDAAAAAEKEARIEAEKARKSKAPEARRERPTTAVKLKVKIRESVHELPTEPKTVTKGVGREAEGWGEMKTRDVKELNAMILRYSKNFREINPRTIDYSLSIGMVGTSMNPRMKSQSFRALPATPVVYTPTAPTADTIETMCTTVFRSSRFLRPTPKTANGSSRRQVELTRVGTAKEQPINSRVSTAKSNASVSILGRWGPQK